MSPLSALFIGRSERGFEFLGYRFGRGRLGVAPATLQRFVERATRLYAQGRGRPEAAPRSGATSGVGVAGSSAVSVHAACEELAADLHGMGVAVLYDNRVKVSPGVKFADAELIGAPVLVTVGRSLAEGVVEVRLRRPADAGLGAGERPETERIPVGDAAGRIGELVSSLLER